LGFESRATRRPSPMAARGDLLSSIRNFKKDTLAKAETDDR
jgi:hypothetical protein